ncbi:MAG: protein translocase subunit SecF [Deltaproteobacteria bacterium]|nr:protein translocase subunit SecF [Deltaproteobacteria bacterium]
MQFIKDDININFIGNRKKAYAFSLALIVISILLLIYRGGPNLGVDFTGGILIQVKMAKAHTPAEIKEALKPVNLEDSIIQEFGEKDLFEYLIRVQRPDMESEGLENKVIKLLSDKFGESIEMRSFEMVGPKVGSDLRDKASMAILFSLLLISIYISGRFELKWLKSITMAVVLGFVVLIASKMKISMVWISIIVLIATIILLWVLKLKYAMGAVIALVHDVTITVGVFALTDREISLSIIAALLTIIGYSLNDTIVVFDRIRENIARFKKRELGEVMNSSINQTLSRTILTAATTLVAVIALYVLGGAVIHDFAFAMMVGIVIGTYSSIFVASPIILAWEGKTEKKK